MSFFFHEPRYLRDGVSVPRIWLAVAVSLLVHALALWQWKLELRAPSEDTMERGRTQGELTVQLAPRPSPPPTPPRPAAPPLKMFEKPRPPAPKTTPQRSAAPQQVAPPPVIARRAPDAQAPLPAPPPEQAAPATPQAPQQDFMAALEARRRARSDAPAPAAQSESIAATPIVEDENARANRIAASNLGTYAKPNFGSDQRRGGGVFAIRHVGYDYGEFIFFGWNKDIRRNTTQRIEVRMGNESNIETAIVRRMIAIIREHEQGDFVFESARLGRNVTLSARARDNAGLEAFMLREFFGEDRRRYRP